MDLRAMYMRWNFDLKIVKDMRILLDTLETILLALTKDRLREIR